MKRLRLPIPSWTLSARNFTKSIDRIQNVENCQFLGYTDLSGPEEEIDEPSGHSTICFLRRWSLFDLDAGSGDVRGTHEDPHGRSAKRSEIDLPSTRQVQKHARREASGDLTALGREGGIATGESCVDSRPFRKRSHDDLGEIQEEILVQI